MNIKQTILEQLNDHLPEEYEAVRGTVIAEKPYVWGKTIREHREHFKLFPWPQEVSLDV